jgi:hypothetical protein
MNKYLTMILPPLQGNLSQTDFFIYAAADSVYFEQHGRALINSVLANTTYGVHIHIYNPTSEQICFCESLDRVSATWEFVGVENLSTAIDFWSNPMLDDPYLSRRKKMLGTKVVDKSLPLKENVQQWLFKTYYACARFIRLAEMLSGPVECLAIDVDGVVRKKFNYQFADHRDFYLHEKEKGGHLAGAILFTNSIVGHQFLQQLSHIIETEIAQDNIYWFLDQWALDQIVDEYNKGYLPLNYIDWYMKPDSAIWSAKGKRKELAVFKEEQKRYTQ